MKILCVGGGSGGHVTPVVAIVAEIKRLCPEAEIRFVTDKRYFAHSVEAFAPLGVAVSRVSAGKFRRYANLSLADHFRHIFRSYLPNLVDVFRFGAGFIQASRLLRRFRPDVVFIKGGYVGLPVGLAAAKCYRRAAIVLHDSDAHPGLTNRILSKYAARIGVGMPLEFSEYDKARTEFVGVPIESCFLSAGLLRSARNDPSSLRGAKRRSNLAKKLPLIFAMGGSQGSHTINQEIIKIAPDFVGRAEFLLVAGDGKFQAVQKQAEAIKNLKVLPFITEAEVCQYMSRAAVVVTRAGATTMAEMAAVGVAAVIIPSPYLASDHQTKNAEIFDGAGAAFVVYEADLVNGELAAKINLLLENPKLRQQFSKNIGKFSKPNAARRMAEIIIEVGNVKNKT
jgi:UDP-N-acetylglucosamine--N-acetylmuramyl-(pentapeptide) pyrophosphoryl-undecaprenol N-acetylglucosamine transferase